MGVFSCERIGDRIRELMQDNGLNQKELAAAVGVTEASMSRYLNNDREPKIDVVAKLAKALHTTTDYLICGTTSESEFEQLYKLTMLSAHKLNDSEVLAIIRALMQKSRV